MSAPSPLGETTTSPWCYVAAAVLGAVLAGGYALTLRTHIGFLDQAIREGRAQTQAAQRQLIDVQGQLQRAQAGTPQGAQLAAILSAPDVVRVDLKATAAGAQAAGPPVAARAFWSASAGLLLTATGLPPLPTSQAYQLWAEPPTGPPYSVGLLTPDAGGRTLLVAPQYNVGLRAADVDGNALVATPLAGPPAGFSVTIEPAGGAASPGGARVLAGSR